MALKSKFFLLVALFFIVSVTSFFVIGSIEHKDEGGHQMSRLEWARERFGRAHPPDFVTPPEDHHIVHDDNLQPADEETIPDSPSIVLAPTSTGSSSQEEAVPPHFEKPKERLHNPLPESTRAEPKDDPSVYTVKLPHVVSVDKPTDDPEVRFKRDQIRDAFVYAYGWYENKCMGKGEMKSKTGRCNDNSLVNDFGLTIIDSLGTMLIMGLDDMYITGRDFLKDKLTWKANHRVSLFETNIRSLGGLLSAYDMTRDPFLLEKAEELAIKLRPAFNTPVGIPKSTINLQTGETGSIGWAPSGGAILAEVGTLQLEWAYLTNATGNPIYAETALKVWEVMHKYMPGNKLYPVHVSINTGKPMGSHVSLGGLGDSFYEYIIKYYIMTNGQVAPVADWFFEVADAVLDQLGATFRDTYYLREKFGSSVSDVFDHLACFTGGMYGLAAQHTTDETRKERYMEAGAGIASFCRAMYDATATGLPFEAVRIRGGQLAAKTSYYLQRPEAVESWFVMWRLTHDQKYRDYGWKFFESIQEHTKVDFGYCGLQHSSKPSTCDDNQQSFFLAETLKYLFLLFTDDDVIPLDEFVFTTEAHPLSTFNPTVVPNFEQAGWFKRK